MTYRLWLLHAQKMLMGYCNDDKNLAYSYAKLLIENFSETSNKKLLFIDGNEEIDSAVLLKLNNALVEMVEKNKPIDYILGTKQFYNILIDVESPVLIPRVETEYWVYEFLNTIIDKNKSYKIVDFCCGTGCIGIMALSFLKQSICDFYDCDKKACDLTEKNCIRNNVIERSSIFNEDIFKVNMLNNYDYILSNPPYISCSDYNKLDDSVKLWEDQKALTDNYDGTSFIFYLIDRGYYWLKDCGVMVIEIDHKKSEEILIYAQKKSLYFSVDIWKDQFDKNRILVCKKSFN